MKYSKIFSVPNTTIILLLIYLYRIGKKIYEVIPLTALGCHALYYTKELAWHYDEKDYCDWPRDALTIITYTFITMSILNTITFVKILHFYNKHNTNIQDKETKKRMKKNTMLFLQTILQDSLYLIDLTFTFKLSSLSSNRVWTFISGTLIWELLHSIDGFVMVIFNERLSFLKKTIVNFSVIPVSTRGPRQGAITVSVAPSTKFTHQNI